MTTSDQAKKGFKTFIITLSVSLVLFSFIYYVVTDSGTDDYEIDAVLSQNVGSQDTTASDDTSDSGDEVLGVVASNQDPKNSVFGELNKKEIPAQQKTVLAGATQSSQSSVPETGVTSITYALIISSAMLSIGAFVYLYGPRRLAIKSFEREVIRSLDKDR